ncbi:MAG: sensor histidine kinase [Spirochaetales bacterium]|nr:sensor histidine kinase [Spirochaetales bacterium]
MDARVPDRARKRNFIIFMSAVVAFSGTMTILSVIEGERFRIFHALGVLMASVAIVLTATGRYKLAVRLAELSLGPIILFGTFRGQAGEQGVSLGFYAALMALCMYFDGLREARWSMAFSAVGSLAWFFLHDRQALSQSMAMNTLSAVGLTIASAAVFSSNFRLTGLDADRLLSELHHRVRNTLQIVHGLASEAADTRDSGDKLRRDLKAMRSVQDVLSRAADVTSVNLSSALTEIAAEGDELDVTIQGERDLSLPMDRAMPALLLASRAMYALPPHTRSVLSCRSDGSFVVMRLDSGNPDAAVCIDDERQLAEALMAQLGAERDEHASCWGIRFGHAAELSYLEKARLAPVVVPGAVTRFLIGVRNAKRSMGDYLLARSLVLYSLLGFLNLIVIAAIKWSANNGIQTSTMLGLVVLAVTYGLTRVGLIMPAVWVFSLGVCVSGALSVLMGSDALVGTQLLAIPGLAMALMHLGGRTYLPLSAAWLGAVYLLWLFAVPGGPPAPSLGLNHGVMLGMFLVMAGIMRAELGSALSRKSTLLIQLRTRLRDDLEILGRMAQRPAADGQGKLDEFLWAVDMLSELHDQYSESALDQDIALMLERDLPRLLRGTGSLDVSASGTGILSAEKAVPAMTLVALSAKTALAGRDGLSEPLKIELHCSGGQVRYSMRGFSKITADELADDPAIMAAAAQLGASSDYLHTQPGAVLFSFPA